MKTWYIGFDKMSTAANIQCNARLVCKSISTTMQSAQLANEYSSTTKAQWLHLCTQQQTVLFSSEPSIEQDDRPGNIDSNTQYSVVLAGLVQSDIAIPHLTGRHGTWAQSCQVHARIIRRDHLIFLTILVPGTEATKRP